MSRHPTKIRAILTGGGGCHEKGSHQRHGLFGPRDEHGTRTNPCPGRRTPRGSWRQTGRRLCGRPSVRVTAVRATLVHAASLRSTSVLRSPSVLRSTSVLPSPIRILRVWGPRLRGAARLLWVPELLRPAGRL